MKFSKITLFVFVMTLFLYANSGWAQSSGSIEGVVKDPAGLAVPNATVEIQNVVSHFDRSASTDNEGKFRFTSVPFNPYHLVVTAPGFESYAHDIDVRSLVTLSVPVDLKVGTENTSITVQGEAADLIETDPTAHTDVDRNLFEKLPLGGSSTISSLITYTTPGVAADSNGLFHGLGEHQENSFSVDGQPITDQQNKIFSNQIPSGAVQSLEAVNGIPPAEYGDKTTLIINVTTRSGLSQRPAGSVTTSYGSFGTSNIEFDYGVGGQHFGNFISASGFQSSRFLDPPELAVIHDKGNTENFFDRVDFQPRTQDNIHVNVNYARSWFQQPNQFDQASAGQDQRVLINTFNIAPAWTHTFNSSTVLSVNTFVRQDRYHYYPSAIAFSDLPATLAQTRHLTNLGVRSDLSYFKGAHNIKAGVQLQHWFLKEQFNLGITDPAFNPPCNDPTESSPCATSGANPTFLAGLAPFDLTRGGSPLNFNDHTDVKETALFVQDSITFRNWSFNLGIRGDLYRGLTSTNAAEPRTAVSYNIKKTGTVLRVGYARAIVTPYNENLLVSSSTGLGGLGGGTSTAIPPKPGYRNLFNAGLEQAFGKYLVVTADYYWKYTKPDYDFGVLFSTPLTFPVQWVKSKIDGVGVRVSVPNFHGMALVTVMGTSRDRFFPPGVGGLIFNTPPPPGVFRIDHDQALQQSTHVQYQWKNTGPWVGFNWRYDSGLVAGAIPCAGCGGNGPSGDNTTLVDTSLLTSDQQFEAGLFCGNVQATSTVPISSTLGVNLCPASQYGSKFIKLPAPGTEDDDKNPPRIKGRNLFDVAVGDDNLFHGDRFKWSARVTVINLANKVALYNFLSTFSGTHYVTPRTVTGELGFHF